MTGRRRAKRARQVRRREQALPSYRARRYAVLGMFALAVAVLLWRAVDQQIFETDFLRREGDRRHIATVQIPVHRGEVRDRHGAVLAVSTPVESVWADPRQLRPDSETLLPLAKALGISVDALRRRLAGSADRSFVYLRRRALPVVVERVRAAVEAHAIRGVGFEREYRRYYPGGEVFTHVVGFTDVDDRGQEGLELAHDAWLRGTPGARRVIRDGRRRVVDDVESIRAPSPGHDLELSLDQRIQFLTYRELKAAVQRHNARAGTAVVLDVVSGEVLAMVNQPSYNPNGSRSGRGGRLRNRAVTDVFEPGSTMKPFTVAAALEQGLIGPDSRIDTSPGYFKVGRHLVRDHRNLGEIDVATLLLKSSNVGAGKLALELPPDRLWSTMAAFGFGTDTATGFPGEASGQLAPFNSWARIDQATLSFGYGISVSVLQLARAYAVLAADGIARPVSLLHQERPPRGERVLSATTARAVRGMLEGVVSDAGTAPAAAVPGYRVAGKTGTVRKLGAEGYSKDRYLAAFVGMAPMSDPRLVMAVVIDEPRGDAYYGGEVAAPVFSRVMNGALRLLNLPPDAEPANLPRLAHTGDGA